MSPGHMEVLYSFFFCMLGRGYLASTCQTKRLSVGIGDICIRHSELSHTATFGPVAVWFILQNHLNPIGTAVIICICMLRPVNITRLLDLSVCWTWFPTFSNHCRHNSVEKMQTSSFHLLSNSLDEHEKN